MRSTQAVLALLLGSTFLFSNAVFAQTKPAIIPAGSAEKPAENDMSTYEYLSLFGDVFERVKAQYVEKVTDKKLIESALNGMLMALDPHSSYLDQDAMEDMRVQTTGEFGGLGIEVTMENGLVKVVSPIDDTPAAKAGIKPGDLVVKLDKEEVTGLTLSDAVDKMRGKVGTPITLTIVREGQAEPLILTVVRDTIKIRAVRSEVEGDDVGYVRITTFNEQVAENLTKALADIKAKAAAKKTKLKGLVLDLRNNPGGLLDQAIFVSDAFLEQGEIVSTRGREKDDVKRENATAGDLIDGMPIVVLINEGSASASEIVAGALQDQRRAIIMGTKSFGKGSVQTVMNLPGHGAMRLTTARYYTPSGRSIQAKGIEPDIEVKLAKIEEVKAKFEMPKEADLHGALKNPDKDEKKIELSVTTKKADNQKDPNDLTADDDYQLARAVDLIRGIAKYEERPQAMKMVPPVAEESNNKTEDKK